MKKTQPPASLYKAAQAHSLAVHERRLKELKTMAPMLARLDELVPALAAKGVELAHSDMRWSFDRSISVAQCHYSDRTTRLLAALLDLGFVEVSRDDYPSFAVVAIKKGRIALRLHIDNRPSAAVAPKDAA